MASISIQGRVDEAVWEGLKNGETNTQLLQRLCSHYAATSGNELLKIAPTFDAAIAVLLNSHMLLNQLVQNAAFAPPEVPTAAPEETAPQSSDRYDDDF